MKEYQNPTGIINNLEWYKNNGINPKVLISNYKNNKSYCWVFSLDYNISSQHKQDVALIKIKWKDIK